MEKRKYTSNTEISNQPKKNNANTNNQFKITLIIGLFALILAIVAIFYLPPLYNLVFGDLNIRYAGFDSNSNLSRIEILNEYKSPLEYVSGTIEISCPDANYSYTSELFSLSDGKMWVPQETNELLFSPDTFFSNLVIKKNDNECTDLNLEISTYLPINETHSKLSKIDSYEFKEEKESIIITEGNFNSSRVKSLCLECQMEIKISTQNKGEFTVTENYIFLSGQRNPITYPPFYRYPIENKVFHIIRFYYGPICFNLSYTNCVDKLVETLNSSLEGFSNSHYFSTSQNNPFKEDSIYNKQVYPYAFSEEEINNLYEQGPPTENP